MTIVVQCAYSQSNGIVYGSEIDGFIKISENKIDIDIIDYQYNGIYNFQIETKNKINFIKYSNIVNVLCASKKLVYFFDAKRCFFEGIGYGENTRSGRHISYIGPAKKYTSSSYLTEGKIKFEALNLSYPKLDSPWVEGVKGDGIGEYIEMEWEYEISGLIIINGFISFEKPELFVYNNRVKRIGIYIDDNKEYSVYNLDDDSAPQILQLKEPGKKIRIEILEVYKGSRWDDTCICMINGISIDAGNVFYTP